MQIVVNLFFKTLTNMALLIKNIKKLVQVEYEPVAYRAGKEMAHLETIDDAFLLTEGRKLLILVP